MGSSVTRGSSPTMRSDGGRYRAAPGLVGDTPDAVDPRRPDPDDELALHPVPRPELLGPIGAHVLRAEEGRDRPAGRQVIDQARLPLDRDVVVGRRRVLDDDGHAWVAPKVRGLDGRVPGGE